MTKNQLREVICHLIKKELKEATMWEPEVDNPEIDTDTETEEEDQIFTKDFSKNMLPKEKNNKKMSQNF